MGILPGVDNDQATVQDNHRLLLGLLKMRLQLLVQCVFPTTLGFAAAAIPHRKSTTGYKRWEAIQPQLQKYAHTLLLHSRLTLKEKDPVHEEGVRQRTHFGTRLSRPQIGPYT